MCLIVVAELLGSLICIILCLSSKKLTNWESAKNVHTKNIIREVKIELVIYTNIDIEIEQYPIAGSSCLEHHRLISIMKIFE